MKAANAAKARVHLQADGQRWLLVVDQVSVIATPDRHWLRRLAVRVRKALAEEGKAS